MEVNTIVENLESTVDMKYKRAEIDEAISRREEIVPLLIDILKKVLEKPEDVIDEYNYMGHSYALLLLGHFKEKSAHELILKLFSLPDEKSSDLFGDMVTETLPNLLLNTCGGCFDGIKELALNTNAYEYCRGSALKAMNFGVVEGFISREEVLSFFKTILENRKSEPSSFLFDELASCICDLYPEELMDIITECYEDDYIHPGYIGLDSFEEALKAGKEECLERIKRDMECRCLDDIHTVMSGWACFEENQNRGFYEGDYDNDDDFDYNSNTGKPLPNAHHKKKDKNKNKMSKASKKKNRKKK
ncbi:MAG: DUF1186 domain-containing protein [Deltaproteobacteria bacterium]|nr:DUF1186 domain-containing protein [Deltaproteobacteria bacterium]